jgi:hypothetical protein
MNDDYRALFVSRVAGAIRVARAVTSITHPVVKGTIQEILLRELFRPLAPSDVGIGTGQIVTLDNRQSSQQDVLIYDRRILPPALFEGTTGLFPVESVLAAVEVKTKLTAAELREAHKNAAEVNGYTYYHGDGESTRIVKHAISEVFALDSDLAASGKTELDRYREIDPTDDPPLRAICVVGRGYWFYDREWRFEPPNDDHEEVLKFIAGLFDMFIKVAQTRPHPGFSRYLFA